MLAIYFLVAFFGCIALAALLQAVLGRLSNYRRNRRIDEHDSSLVHDNFGGSGFYSGDGLSRDDDNRVSGDGGDSGGGGDGGGGGD